jgi:hypothetical protein
MSVPIGSSVQQLDPSQQSEEALEFEHALGAKIVGQSEAVRAVVDTYQVFRAGLSAPGRPVGNLMSCRRQTLTRRPMQRLHTRWMGAFETSKTFPEVLAVTGVEVTS